MNQKLIAVALASLPLGFLLPVVAVAQGRAMVGPSPFECKNNNPCKTQVTVTAGETKADGKVDPNGCTVSWAYNGYVVKERTKPKLVWQLSYTGPDTYKFHPNDGVILNSADLNDPNKDLYGQGHDSVNGQKFRWRDHNSRKRDKSHNHTVAEERGIRFDFVILRDRDGYKCAAGDPVVINMGQ